MPKRAPVWNHFGEPFSEPGSKQKRRKCKYCLASVGNNSRNAATHFNNCSRAPRTIGRLPAGIELHIQPSEGDTVANENITVSEDAREVMSATQVDLPKGRPKRFSHKQSRLTGPIDVVTVHDKEELAMKFSNAINASSMSFNAFDTPEWAAFFKLLRPGMF